LTAQCLGKEKRERLALVVGRSDVAGRTRQSWQRFLFGRGTVEKMRRRRGRRRRRR